MSDKQILASRTWTESEDEFLIFYGRCLNLAFGGEPAGYHHVAQHDLNRTPEDAVARVATLRRERPEFVAKLEAEADREPEDGG